MLNRGSSNLLERVQAVSESGRDVVALQALMGHRHPDTTQQYTDEVKLDELAEALARAAETRDAQASPDLATLDEEVSDELETLRWRRRESNPRKVPAA
jgi:endonuclease/exonuclease/phosphatase family metal-dependent hydrolase